jgi:hypothetical protein
MDPATLATTATSLLLPYIVKAGKLTLDKISEGMPETLGNLWKAISNKSTVEPDVAKAANEIVQEPDNPDNQENFNLQLRRALKKDEAFASQLAELVEKVQNDSSIKIGGDGVVATNNSIAVSGGVQISSNSGSVTFGNVQQGIQKKE